MRLILRTILTVVLMALVGCSTSRRQIPVSVEMAGNDPITTVAQYDQAVKAAKEGLPASITTSRGIARVLACIAEMRKLPSVPCRGFTQALIDALRNNGIAVADLPFAWNTPQTISYGEMAMIDVLTMNLFEGRGEDESRPPLNFEQRVSFALSQEITRVVAEECPNDFSALKFFFLHIGGASRESVYSRLEAFRQNTSYSFNCAFARLRDAARPLNLTSLIALEDLWDAGIVDILMWANVTSRDSGSGHELLDWRSDMRAALARVRTMDLSPDVQSHLNGTEAALKDPALVEKLDREDANLKLAGDAANTIRVFFQALRADDRTALRKLMSPTASQSLAKYLERLQPAMGDDFGYQIVANFSAPNTVAVAFRSSKTAKSDQMPDGFGWFVFEFQTEGGQLEIRGIGDSFAGGIIFTAEYVNGTE